MGKWKRTLSRVAASVIAAGSFLTAPAVSYAADGDIFGALAGVLGTAGLYAGYLTAILDAGNNAYYQEESRLYDIKKNGVDPNPNDHAVVDSVMRRLTERGDYVLDIRSLPFRWNVNNNQEFNAACFPTNYITVNRGLVRGLGGQRDELAAVLAHEMTHGVKLHSAYSYARAAAEAFGIAFLGMVTGKVSPEVTAVIADYTVAKNVILPAEYEADEGGFFLAASAGFNPGGAAAAMARMDWMAKHPESFTRGYGEEPYDHPDTDKREARLAGMMADWSCGHVSVKDRSEVMIDGHLLLKASYSTELYDDTPEQAYLIAGALAKAFHDYDSIADWAFRGGMNGRVDYLTDEHAYSPLKEAVASARAESLLQSLVASAYDGEAASGARERLRAGEAEREAKWQERRVKNAKADERLITRLYENADKYNDIYRPELAIEEGARSFAYEGKSAKRAGVYAVRARAKATQGDLAGAMADADYAISLDPYDAYVHLNRAEVLRVSGRPEEALQETARAIALDDKAPAAFKMAADIYDELGRGEEAKEAYRRLHKLLPEAMVIPDEYIKEIDPKQWKKISEAREEKRKAAAKKREKEKKK